MKYYFFALLFLLSIGLDQGTKLWARHSLKPHARTAVTVVPGYFDLRYTENPGAAFSLLRNTPGARYFFLGVGLVCLGVVGAWLRKVPAEGRWMAAKLGLLLGGAMGNVLDRLAYGKVTDFILWKISLSGRLHEWPIFNIADVALVIGIALMILDWPRDHASATGYPAAHAGAPA